MSEVNYPIAHWSYSSLKLFLSNRLQFKKQYILKIYDFKSSPAMVIGKAAHKAMEFYYNKKGGIEQATAEGLRYINTVRDEEVDWGKTGSRDKVIASYTQALQFYWQEEPKVYSIKAVEKSMTQYIEMNGTQLAIPAKAIADLIVRNADGELEIWDHKFVSSYSDSEGDNPEHLLQAMFYYHVVEKEFGEKPTRMLFNELKITENKDATPQLQPYEIVYAKHPDYFQVFYQIYNDCTQEISKPDCKYLPNISDMLSGKESFEEYKKGIITVDAPVVAHRTSAKPYEEKKYVASEATSIDYDHLPAEEKIRVKLQEFGIPVEMQETHAGPSVTLYTMKPSRGVKMSQFETHTMDLALALQAKSIRVEAPIMGTNLVGVEVSNEQRTAVPLEEGKEYGLQAGTLNIPIGVNVYNKTIVKPLDEMPHLLVAGTTGSGKSVFINVLINSLVKQNGPDTLRMILIDPKRVELSRYRELPHLLTGVIYDEKKATLTMNWLVEEMERRYDMLEQRGYRTLDEYNRDNVVKIHRIAVVIDEFADLMLQNRTKGAFSGIDIETCIIRLAQKARAAGIYLVLGTQRPSVDVITGLLKANIAARIAFMTASRVDSQVIIDTPGAEELTGKGDMLFADPHKKGLQRLQGFYIEER